MKLEKKHWIIIGIVIAVVIIWYFFFKKKKTESSYDPNLLIYGNDSNYSAADIESGYYKGRNSFLSQLGVSRVPSSVVAPRIVSVRKEDENIPLGAASHRMCCVEWDEYGNCTKKESTHVRIPCPSKTISRTTKTD